MRVDYSAVDIGAASQALLGGGPLEKVGVCG